MSYTLIAFDHGSAPDLIRRDADGAIIPADPLNTDWQAYLAWRAAGNAPAPATTGVPVAAPPQA